MVNNLTKCLKVCSEITIEYIVFLNLQYIVAYFQATFQKLNNATYILNVPYL